MKKTKPTSSADWMYYHTDRVAHDCERKDNHDDLYEMHPGHTPQTRLARCFRGLFICWHNNSRAIRMFRSRACIDFERSKQLRLHPWMIHPFSVFRVFWEILVIVVLAITSFLSLYEITYMNALKKTQSDSYARQIMLRGFEVSDWIFLFNCAICTITGRRRGNTRQIELKFLAALWTYLTTYFVLDAVGLLPNRQFSRFLRRLYGKNYEDTWYPVIRWIAFAKHFARILRASVYVNNTCKVVNLTHDQIVFVFYVLGMLVYFHFMACFTFFVVETFDEDNPDSWMNVFQLKSLDAQAIYAQTLIRSVSSTLGLCIRFVPLTIEDHLQSMVFHWIGAIVFLCLVGKYLQMTTARNSSRSLYDSMTTEVEQFMDSRKLPKKLRQRVLEFYEFRFQGTYFNEAAILRNTSRQLRQDFMFRECKGLVDQVAFFAELPTMVLIRIVSIMKVEFFLRNETVIELNSTGTCMYFIKAGTVIVYASSGKEVCHLEDGNHFGEIALVLAHFRRVASVIAGENCELFRLDRDDFNLVMASYPQYLEKVRNTAMKRLAKAMRSENIQYDSLDDYITAHTTEEKSKDKRN